MESRLIGKIVSRRFRVEDIVGRGGMAIVYHAFDLKTKQAVALKVLREEYENEPEYKERFKREAEVCRKLSHPNVVNMIDSGVVGGVSYIALEYVDGKTLKEIITEAGKLGQEEAVRYALQILAALGHAHQRGIVHRDIKPQNVMITRTGQVKVGDFGIAGMADTKTLTSDGNVMGSVHYFSPEQAKGMKATAASDLYSVGIILYEMLSGHVPFDGETAVSVAMMHLMEPPKPIEDEAQVCPAIAMIVKKSLEKKPEDRYQNADAMIRDLRRALRHPDGGFLQQHKNTEEKTSTRVTQRKRVRRRQTLVGWMLTLFVVLMVIGLIGVACVRLYSSMFLYVRMPYLMGMDAATAERLLTSSELMMQTEYAYSSEPEGYVGGQDPAPEAYVRRGSTVKVVISRGSGMTLVQRFVGMTQTEAMAAIVQQGFTVGEVTVVPSEQMRGMVVSQSPDAGTNAQLGGEISLSVSGGRVVVPELSGEREEEARERAVSVGLTVAETTYRTVTTARQDGIVLEQTPAKFTEVLPGSEVTMTVGRYDRRKYTAPVQVTVEVPAEGVTVRVTLVGEDGKESDMYEATLTEPGSTDISVELRSEQSGVRTWRLYLDGSFKYEATAVLQ